MGYVTQLKNFLLDNKYNEKECFALLQVANKIVVLNAFSLLEDIVKEYVVKEKIDTEQFRSQVIKIANTINEHEYTVFFIVYVTLVIKLKDMYVRKKYNQEMYIGIINDLKAKFNECINVKNIYGTFTQNWFEKFLNFENFAIGRLQFNFKPMPEDYMQNGRIIKKGDMVIAIHIPSGKPLENLAVVSAIKQAKEFFFNKFNLNNINFICRTYLFHPSMVNLYKENSNLKRFYQMFDVFSLQEDKLNSNAWRVFNCENANYMDLPEQTSLQRGLKQYLINGGKMGVGIGVLNDCIGE